MYVIACPVDASAATPTLPLADGNYLVFSGGIALNAMPSVASMRIAGVWNLTGNWTEPPTGTSIMSGSTVTVSGVLDDGYNIVVNANATLQVATARANLGADNKNRFLYKNDGTFIVTGEMQDKILHSSGSYSLAGFFEYGNNNAVTRANGLVHAGSTKNGHQFRLNSKSNSATNTIVLGSGGLSFRNNLERNSNCYPYFQIDSGKSAVLASSADWSFGANPVSGKDLCLELCGAVTVDTSDYGDRTIPHTIRVVGRIGNHGKVTVTGCGTMAFEHSSDFEGGLDVKDTATVSFNSGCGLGRCGANMASGTTFKVAQPGTVTLGGNLTLASGSNLAFFLSGNADTTLAIASDKTLTVNGTVAVKFAEGSIFTPGRAYTLLTGANLSNANAFKLAADIGGTLSVESGKLVYTAPNYFYIKIADAGRFSLKDSSGDTVTVDIPLEWIYAKTKTTDSTSPATVADALKGSGANGVSVWKSYCLGLDPADSQSVILCDAAAEQPSDGKVGIAVRNLSVPEALSTVTVTAYLDSRTADGVWSEGVASTNVSSGTATLTSPAIASGLSFFA